MAAKDPDPIEKGVEELGEEITCAVCYEYFIDPKILPCCHYYCKKCVRAMADRENPFACPQCRRPAELPTNRDPAVLPTAYFINRIKDVHGKMEKARGRVAARCEMCATGKAEAFCRQCTEFICSDCARSHEKMKAKFPGHMVVSLEELREGGAKQIPPMPAPPIICEGHEKRMKLYCFDCGNLICRDCIVIDHVGHKFEFAKKCAVEYRAKASKGIQQLAEIQLGISHTVKCIQERKGVINEQGRQASASITATFDNIRCILARHEAKLQKETSELVEQKVTSLTAQDKNLQLALAEVHSLADFVRHNVEGATDEELMMVHKQIESNVEEQWQRFIHLNRELVEEADISKKISITAAVYLFTSEITRDPSQYRVSGPGLKIAEIGKETHVVVSAVSADGQSCEIPLVVEGELCSLVDGSVINIHGESKAKGRYQLAYTPITRGRHNLSITVNGRQIVGSPFQSVVRVDPTQLGKSVKHFTTIGKPFAMTMTADERFVVSSIDQKQIVILAKSGEKLITFACNGVPTGVAVDDIGCIYVALQDIHSLCKFDEQGRKLKEVKDILNYPSGVNIINNQVLVCDRWNRRIAVFNTDLVFIRSIGAKGHGDGEFNNPEFLTQDEEGRLWITDFHNQRVCIFTADFEYLCSVVKPAGKGKLSSPAGIACDSGYVYVSELDGRCVSVFTVAGDFVCSFGRSGSGDGELYHPRGVLVDRDGFLYVCDRDNSRIQIY